MNWVVLILIGVVLYAVSVLLQRIILKKDTSDPVAYSIIFQIVTGLFLLLYGLLFGKLSFQNTRNVVPNLVLMSVLYGLGNILVFQSLKLLEASVFTIVNSSRVLFTILTSTFFLHEALTSKQNLGIFFILSAIVIIYFSRSLFKINRGILFALLASLLFGIEVTNDKYILKSFNFYAYMVIIFWFPAIFSYFIRPSIKPLRKVLMNKALMIKMVILTFLYSASAIFYFLALKINNSSQVASLNQLGTIMIVILAVIFLKEKDHLLKKFIATIVAIAGAVLLVQ